MSDPIKVYNFLFIYLFIEYSTEGGGVSKCILYSVALHISPQY